MTREPRPFLTILLALAVSALAAGCSQPSQSTSPNATVNDTPNVTQNSTMETPTKAVLPGFNVTTPDDGAQPASPPYAYPTR
jgi:uncharacterized lipoprotein YajG